MKKIILMLTLTMTLLLTACGTGNKVARQQQQQALAQAIDRAVHDGDFTISILRMKPLHGVPQQVSYGYDLTVHNNTVISHLPYVGEVYHVPYGGGKGLNFEGAIQEYGVQYPSDDKARVVFTVTNDEDTYQYHIVMYSNGKATIDVYARERNAISYDGEFVMKEGQH